MSLSDEYTEWHLTPRGWERGTERSDGEGTTVKPRPSDAVLSFTYRERLTHSRSDLHKTCLENWRSTDRARVDELLKQFGPCPERL